MRFERGKDPKEVMDVGLEVKAPEIIGIYIEAMVTYKMDDMEEDGFLSDIVHNNLAEIILAHIANGDDISEILRVLFLKEIERTKPQYSKYDQTLKVSIREFGMCFIAEHDKTMVLENHLGECLKLRGKLYQIPEDYEL